MPMLMRRMTIHRFSALDEVEICMRYSLLPKLKGLVGKIYDFCQG